MTNYRKFFSVFKSSINLALIAVFTIVLLFSIAIYSYKYFGYLSLILDLSILVNLLVIASWKYQFSLPVFSKQLRNKYAELKTYLNEEHEVTLKYFYKKIAFKLIYWLSLLFYNVESATNIIRDGEDPMNIKFNLKLKKHQQVYTEYLKEYFKLLEQKKRRAAICATSVSTLTVLVFLIVVTIFMKPVLAATYGWVQTDWSGGTSSTAIAVHPGDQSAWTKFSTSTSITFLGNGTSFQLATSSASSMDSGTLTTSTSGNLTTGGGFGNGAMSGLSSFGSGAYTYLTALTSSLPSTPIFSNVTTTPIAVTNSYSASLVYDPNQDIFLSFSGLLTDSAQQAYLHRLNAETMSLLGDVLPSYILRIVDTTSIKKIIYQSNNVWLSFSGSIFKYSATTTAPTIIGSRVIITNGLNYMDYDASRDVIWTLRSTGFGMLQKVTGGSAPASSTAVATAVGTPTGIAYDSHNDVLWVTGASGILQKINAGDLTSAGTTTISGTAHKIVYDPDSDAVWVSSGNVVEKFNADGAPAATLGSVACTGGGTVDLIYSATERAVFAVCGTTNTIIKIDATASPPATSTPDFYSGHLSSPLAIAYNSAKNELAYTVQSGGFISIASKISAHDFSIRNVTQGTYNIINNPESILYDSVNNAIWVAGGGSSGKLEKYNASTGALSVGNISLGGTPRGLSYDSMQNAIWVVNNSNSTMQKFNADGSSAISTITLSGSCIAPTATAYDSTQNQIWVACYGNTTAGTS